MKPFLKRYRQIGALIATLFLLFAITLGLLGDRAQAQPTPIRRIDPYALSAQIYEQLPDFPLENQYISSDTGTAATENTLVSRLIRYHIYTQNRPTVFRLDWKLTLADYLGAFEGISSDSYPDYGLQENPYANDIAAIESLSPQQRNTLVNTLYEVFTTSAEPEASQPAPPSQ
ncbi:MAG: hypothetical protein ACFB16_25460 [Phormidesmis sp.]